MLIGSDFPKIEFDFFGLSLLEPNTALGDFFLFSFSFSVAVWLYKKAPRVPFFYFWMLFFLFFSLSFLLGGLGHLLFNYWGIAGKTLPWFFGIFSIYFVEQAMLSINKQKQFRFWLSLFSKTKFFFSIAFELWVVFFFNLEQSPSQGLIVPAINSSIGLLFFVGVLPFFYYPFSSPCFVFFVSGVVSLIPSVFFQSMKINFHPFFDKNDASHSLLLIAVFLFFLGIKKHLSLQK
tara:strand:- start:53201 stop:53902 length:702 start_codon:yes stop_codon:yes gene_type:complete